MKGKRLTQEEFISRVQKLYGDNYILDEAIYVNNRTKVKIICKKHGEFYVIPNHLLHGHGCKLCSYEKMSDTFDNFVKKANKVHNSKYSYVEYKNSRTDIKILCPIHGEFIQNPSSHLSGCGCPKCDPRGTKCTTSWFIEKARKIHGNKYDYSKVNYVNNRTKICIICPKHGEFWQTPLNHLKGYGCQKCWEDKQYLTEQGFIEKARKIHGNKYDYSKVNYVNNHTKVCIICPNHGEFWQTPNDHLSGHGCKYCNDSKLENEIKKMLSEKNILFEQCSTKTSLVWLQRQHLDFYLPKHNIAIECQGIQHYEPTSFNNDKSKKNVNKNFKVQQERDLRKKKLCKENGVKLLYFTHYDGVELDNVETFNDKEKLLEAILGSKIN